MMGYMLLVTQFAHAIYSRQKLPHNIIIVTHIYIHIMWVHYLRYRIHAVLYHDEAILQRNTHTT